MTEKATLTYGLRELVWSIEAEVAQVSTLSRRVDEHARALNDLRAQLAVRLLHLDELLEAAEDPVLQEFLLSATEAPLPVLAEEFPERMYG